VETPLSILKKYWRHEQFREPQAAVIDAVLAQQDVIVIIPTGGGKSLCFQVPTLLMEGLCLVVTPLIALMDDQVTELKKRGIPAIAIHSGMRYRELDIALDNCVYGNIKFLYLSPERLLTELFRERLKKMKVCLIAVDEAHCISQWGYDFRPPYLQIAELREMVNEVPFIALTASATKLVRVDIEEKLQLKDAHTFQRSVERPNVSFVVRKTENKDKKLLEVLTKVKGSAIVYVRSRKGTKELALTLAKNKVSSHYYHAGLTHAEKWAKQEDWLANRVRIMVATNAFGMGINKADVRLVVHLDLPENVESYYQEAGRAGRDGEKAYAVLIHHEQDGVTLRKNMEQSQPRADFVKKVYQSLANYYQLAVGGSAGESYDFDLEEFSKRFSYKPLAVYPALKRLEEAGLIQLNEAFYRPSRLNVLVDKLKLYEFQVAYAKFDPLIKTILRMYGSAVYSDFAVISEKQLAKSLNTTTAQVMADLHYLHKLQLVDYEPASEMPQITYVVPRQDAMHLPLDMAAMETRRQLNLAKMEAMIRYAEQKHQCRMQFIQNYFDEDTFATCGICDVCIDKRKKANQFTLKGYRNQVLYLLENPMPADELEKAVAPDDNELFIEVLREMVDANEIAYDEFWVLHKVSGKASN
jgi:ATP-dependent DNA helicase RecQ